jgi:3'-5' exoribonuclease
MRKKFGRDAAAGKSGGEMTDWVRSMERPLMNSKAFLGESDECAG